MSHLFIKAHYLYHLHLWSARNRLRNMKVVPSYSELSGIIGWCLRKFLFNTPEGGLRLKEYLIIEKLMYQIPIVSIFVIQHINM